MREKLTARRLNSLEVTGKEYEVHDTTVPGLFVRVTAAGAKSYVVTWARGRKKALGRVGILTLEQAREEALQYLNEARKHGEATLACLKDRGWSSPATLSAALRELEGAGLIAKTRQGGIASLSKVCSLYRFTDLPVFEQKNKHHQISEMEMTFDYRKFQSVEEAKQAIAEFVGEQKQLNQRGTKAAVSIEEARRKRKLQIA